MGEATRDKESSRSESKKDKQKTKGWIRMHTDEDSKTPPEDEQENNSVQSPDRKVRKLEEPIE